MPMYSTRTLSVAWEMWLHHSVLVPYLNGLPYSDKPPLLLWLIQLGWAVAGVGDVWPRLLEVILGAIELMLAWHLARQLFPRERLIAHATAWMLLAFTYGFLFGLQIMYEVLLADCVLAALLCLAPAAHGDAPRFGWYSLFLGLGLLTKGPVMLLHAGLPWLLGPVWSERARRERWSWYRHGGLACLGACGLLLAWALLAAWAGGETYRRLLLVHQTAGRVVDAFAHAQPFWWYLPLLPVLAFPFSLWPRTWKGLWIWRHPNEPGMRFLLAWLCPSLLAFSAISGKQAYYLLPEFACIAMMLATASARSCPPEETPGAWWSLWPLAALLALVGTTLIGLEWLVAHRVLLDPAFASIAPRSRPFGILYLLLALVLVVPRRGELYRVAGTALVAVVAANGLFSITLWPAYDFTPVSQLLAAAQREGRPVANLESNDGQYTFLGRLTQPIDPLHGTLALREWSARHPDGIVVVYPKRLSAADREQALYTQPFRGISLALWQARSLVQALPQETL
jgi:4-amino-4-deoxy-L-arabinose transferase-like glycosyltransferase